MSATPAKTASQADFLVDPVALRILLVDANSTSGAKLSDLLRKCSYQVTACSTSQQAIRILKEQDGEEGSAGFDLILKEHCPANGSNACRLLKKAQTEPALQGIPIIVASTTEDRDVMVNCLQLGAADYMMKPLRPTELRNLWARVYWWRRASYLQQQSSGSDTPQATSLEQFSGSSLDTIRENQEAQDGNVGERSAEGSAPNGEGSAPNGNGSKGLGSKNGSKEYNVGWSGNQTKPGSGHGTSGEGVGNSASKPCMASNHPSSVDGAACLLELRKQVSETSQKSKQDRSSLETDTAVEATPFKAAEAQKYVMTGRQPARNEHSNEAELAGSPAGFRAYRSKDARKRSSGSLEGEAVQKHSGSSGRTNSLEAPPEKLRRIESQPRSHSLDVSEGRLRPPLPASATAGAATGRGGGHFTNSQGAIQMPEDSSQTQANFNPFYPFGVMPNPFTMAQLWNQFGNRPSEADMAQHFVQLQQAHSSGQAAPMSQGEQQQQQQQQMLHNQLMLQHNLMMLHSLPGNPFACFSNFDNAPGNQMANQQSSAPPASMPPAMLRSQPESALPSIQQAMNPSRSQAWEAQSQGQRPQPGHLRAGLPAGQTPAAEQSLPLSGRRGDAGHGIELGTGTEAGTGNGTITGTGTATGNTLGAGNSGNANGATSHTTAQVGLDGCLVEPSQQERRAQALHKYKQKRKNLCFTKKIRYESRKQLAQARPRVKGQFVRVGDIADAVDALTEAGKDCGGSQAGAGATVSTYVAGRKDGETQMIKLPGQSGGENLKATQVYDDTESEEVYEEDTESVSPALLAQGTAIKAADTDGKAANVDVSNSLPMASQACTS